MNRQIPSYLKLVPPPGAEQPSPDSVNCLSGLLEICGAFEDATHWSLEYADGANPRQNANLMWSAPVDPGVGASPGHLRLRFGRDSAEAKFRRPTLKQAARLAGAVAQLWNDLVATRAALRVREAELAAGVPVVARPDERERLADRLVAILRAACEAVCADAAALYLLDEGTTELKLRTAWGLPDGDLVGPARPLRGATADLESLLGHAVVLNDPQLASAWHAPHDFPSSVCVPVSTPSTPLGTLWVLCKTSRDFSDAQVNMLEMTAGRLAAELEREMLLNVAQEARATKRGMSQTEHCWQSQLPNRSPLIDGWEIAGRICQSDVLGGNVYDWFGLADGSVAAVIGAANQSSVGGALVATAVRAATRAQAAEGRSNLFVDKLEFNGATIEGRSNLATDKLECSVATPQPRSNLATDKSGSVATAKGPFNFSTPEGVLAQVNHILWSGSAGHEATALAYAVLSPGKDRIELAGAGPLGCVILPADAGWGWQPFASEPLVGSQDESVAESRSLALDAGQCLIMFGASQLHDVGRARLDELQRGLAAHLASECLEDREALHPAGETAPPSLSAQARLNADQLAERACAWLERALDGDNKFASAGCGLAADRVVLVIKRREQ